MVAYPPESRDFLVCKKKEREKERERETCFSQQRYLKILAHPYIQPLSPEILFFYCLIKVCYHEN